jgi:hypothetical protein
MTNSVGAEDELNNAGALGGEFSQSVEKQLKHRKEQFEAPTPKIVIDKLTEFNQGARKLARKISTNKIVEWIPVVSPLINASLDMQKAGFAVAIGKDADTGRSLTVPERAQMAVSKYGSSLWEQAKVGVDVAFLAVGGTIVEKAGFKAAHIVVKHGVQLVAHEALKKGGDRMVYGKDGRKVEVSAGDPKMQAAEQVVDGMSGMYSAVAEMTKDADTKKLLTDASETFGKIVSNPNTRTALATSLAQSEHINGMMAKMAEMKNNPESMNSLKAQLSARK